MSRASEKCETITKDQTFRGEVTEGKDDKEIMFENLPTFLQKRKIL